MTAHRTTWLAAAAALALAAQACVPKAGPDTDDTDADESDDGPPDTETTEPPPDTGGCEDSGCDGTDGVGAWAPAYLRVEANFGWNDDLGSFVDVVTPQGTYAPAIVLLFGSEAWEADGFDAGSDRACALFLPLTDPAPAPWLAEQPSMVWAVDYDPAAGVAGDCNSEDYPFDPAEWGPTPELDLAESGGWGVAIGAIVDAWAAEYAGSPYEAFVFGGQIQNVELPPPDGQLDYFAFAEAIDDANELVFDPQGAPVLIEAADVLADPIQQGWYFVVNNSVWTIVAATGR